MKSLIVIILSALFLTSCVTQRGFEKYADKHPTELAELCDEEFPCDVTSIDTQTVYIDTGKVIDLSVKREQELIDSMNKLYPDTSVAYQKGLKKGISAGYEEAKEECKRNPTIKTIVVTQKVEDTRKIQIEIGAKEKLAKELVESREEIDKLTKDVKKKTEKVKEQRQTIWISWGIVVLLIGFIFRKPLFKMIRGLFGIPI